MKLVTHTFLTLLLLNTAFAQDAGTKKIQAGITTNFGLNFQRMGTSYMQANGVGTDFSVGLMLNYHISESIGISTGLEFDFNRLKYAPGAGKSVYYYYNDVSILGQGDVNSSSELFQLSARKEKAIYLTIPAMLLFKTKYIGYFRYFGKFGLRNSFKLSDKIYDDGFSFSPETTAGVRTSATNENMTAPSGLFFYKGSVGVAAGAEWNFTGTTVLSAELGFYYGFTPLYVTIKDSNLSLFSSNQSTSTYFSNKAAQNQLTLKVAVLF